MPGRRGGKCRPVLVRVPESLLEVVDETVAAMNKVDVRQVTRTGVIIAAIEAYVALEDAS